MTRTLAVAALAALLFAAAALADPINKTRPRIVGAAVAGKTVRASTGAWDVAGQVDYEFRWLRCKTNGTGCTPLKVAGVQLHTSSIRIPRTLTGALRVTVIATDNSGTAAALSAPVKITR